MTVSQRPPQTEPSAPSVSPQLRTVLGQLRARIRHYVWLEGVAGTIEWAGCVFWTSMVLDWFFELSVALRVIALVAAVASLGVAVFMMIVRRLTVPLPDQSMALLLERRFPQLNESLQTAIELADRPADGSIWNRTMLARTCAEASQRINGLPLSAVFNPRPLRRRLTIAAMLTLLIATFGATMSEEMSVWGRRNLLLSQEPWPRRTHLSIDGFPGGVAKVARGSDLEVLARVDTRLSKLIPPVVQVRYRVEGGPKVRAAMNRVGVADLAKDPFQEYSFTFRGLLSPVRFDLIGGDATVRDLRIEVVDNPVITMELEREHPAYTKLRTTRDPVTGAMSIPVGSRVTVHAAANKDLERVQIDTVVDDQPLTPEVLRIDRPQGDRRSFDYTIARLEKDTTLLFTLTDVDGIRSREPVRLSLAAVPDESPKVAVQLRGVGSAVTAKARIPVAGQVTDDYGVARAWFEYAVDQQTPASQPIAQPADQPTAWRLDEVLDVRPFKLAPGHKLTVGVKAADGSTLKAGPNVGVGERWMLDIVTPEQLRTLLEARELLLRQRFEAIQQEVNDTRTLVTRIEFGVPAPASSAREPGESPRAEKAADPPDEPSDGNPPSPERFRSLQALRVDRAMQNGRKNAHEILGVAESFDDIRQQLVNNRIDTEELIQRVKGGIADPLHRVVDEMFPELERRLERLRATLGDERLGPENRTQARQQIDAILTVMRQVLDRMVELESFNEAVELLRAIIQSQDKLNEQTKLRHKQKLRDLLKE
jgi:hypothetical protein